MIAIAFIIGAPILILLGALAWFAVSAARKNKV